jgi:uncharacterized membrane protein YqjE
MAYQVERTFSDVLQDIVGNVQSIIRSEIRLAKTEVKEETGKAAKAAVIIAGGALFGIYALGFLLLTASRALEIVMAPWLASFIVGIVTAVGAFVAVQAGRTRMRYVHPAPDKTIRSVKENVEWVKEQTR